MAQQIKDYMTTLPHTVGEGADIVKAKEMMEKLNCHHLPVLDGGHLVGIISFADLGLALLTTKGKQTLVRDVMTPNPLVVSPDETIKSVCTKMVEGKMSSAVVRATETAPWGIFTSTDAMRFIAST